MLIASSHISTTKFHGKNTIWGGKGFHSGNPSKCPKFYTNRILEEQNVRQKVRKFCQNYNRDKMAYFSNIL